MGNEFYTPGEPLIAVRHPIYNPLPGKERPIIEVGSPALWIDTPGSSRSKKYVSAKYTTSKEIHIEGRGRFFPAIIPDLMNGVKKTFDKRYDILISADKQDEDLIMIDLWGTVSQDTYLKTGVKFSEFAGVLKGVEILVNPAVLIKMTNLEALLAIFQDPVNPERTGRALAYKVSSLYEPQKPIDDIIRQG